jgi:hypothetical protein
MESLIVQEMIAVDDRGGQALEATESAAQHCRHVDLER